PGKLATSEADTKVPNPPATFNVVLTSQPQGASVTMTLGYSGPLPAEGTVSPGTLTFTVTKDEPYVPATGVGGWNVPHVVSIMGADDLILDFSQTYFVTTGQATGADYTALAINPIDPQVTNLDDEQIPALKHVWGGGCGLSGFEVLIPLGLIALRRRRRRNA